MGRPLGSSNKDKPFRDALRLEIAAAMEDGADPRNLRKIASALLTKASEGDVAAIREVGDRIDGKVPTPVGGTDELPPIRSALDGLTPDVIIGLREALAAECSRRALQLGGSGTEQVEDTATLPGDGSTS